MRATPLRFLARIWLAGRYFRKLHYPWRRAWLQAERA